MKHGFWNVLEHGLTRISDAASSLILLWVLSPEMFSKLALAQTIVVPLLFFFIAPENVFYRDYAKWMRAGSNEAAQRLHALRVFAWSKAIPAILISLVVAGMGEHHWVRFWSLIWAFALALAPQISGPDREFLRLSLKLRTLNANTFYQKLALLLGTILASLIFPGRIDALAAFAVFMAVSTAFLARWMVRQSLLEMGASPDAILGRNGPPVMTTIRETMVGFSLWQHLNGIVIGWVQTMDLFFLGVLKFPARDVGLYAAVLKLANVAIALPLAFANTFSLWIGRRLGGADQQVSEAAREGSELRRLSIGLALFIVAQGLVLYALSPYLFQLISHGRWSQSEQALMGAWLKWILIGSSLFAIAWPLVNWLIVRTDVKRIFYRLYLPWLAISIAVYFVAALRFGIMGAAFANVIVSISYLIFVGRCRQ